MGDPKIVTAEERQKKFIREALKRNPDIQVSSYLSALFDAAHLCDAIGRDIAAEHTKRGRKTKLGIALENAVIRAGNAIWNMREKLQ